MSKKTGIKKVQHALPKIESDIPIPQMRIRGRRSKWLGLIEQMSPGDSIAFPNVESMRSFKAGVRKYLPNTLTLPVRLLEDGSYRVWLAENTETVPPTQEPSEPQVEPAEEDHSQDVASSDDEAGYLD